MPLAAPPPTRHPLPPRPHFKARKPSENTNTNTNTNTNENENTGEKNNPRPARRPMHDSNRNRTPLAGLHLPAKPIVPFPPPAKPLYSAPPPARQSAHCKRAHISAAHSRAASVRSLSSSSTLLSPTTREDARVQRASEHFEPAPGLPDPPVDPPPSLKRVLAVARLRQVASDAAVRKTTAIPPRPQYTPKPLLLASKLARTSSQKRNSIHSQTLDQLIGPGQLSLDLVARSVCQDPQASESNLHGPPYRSGPRRKPSEAVLSGHRRTYTDLPRPGHGIEHARTTQRLSIDSSRSLTRLVVSSPRSVSRLGIDSPARPRSLQARRASADVSGRSRYDSFYQQLGPEQLGSAPNDPYKNRSAQHYPKPTREQEGFDPMLLSPDSTSSHAWETRNSRRVSRQSGSGLTSSDRSSTTDESEPSHRHSVFGLPLLSRANENANLLSVNSGGPERPRALRACRSESALLVKGPLSLPRIDCEAVFVGNRNGAAAGRLKTILEEAEPETSLLDRIVKWWN